MLLSMYLSYYWARDVELRSYLTRITLSILVISLSSTVLPNIPLFLVFSYPFASLSFPFSSSGYYPFSSGGYYIQFLSREILFVSNGGIRLLIFFSFYLLVNFLGVILGYWLEKKLAEEQIKTELFEFFSISGFCSFGACYFISLILYGTAVTLRLNVLPSLYIIFFFCVYYFWVPALIATAIYGLKRRKE
jgi:hypothetical protein